ncbi:hypothetical protein PO883_17045 [Massilia sp. DJPM01]|uniref:hypothetical protein n=1 Tax=Massilia sp. DJPM01 TaxID=3024404 RepID=UPI00259E6C9F|nr:hypothetical protein [Massilia sp. DJPM01]MDM5178911.1 hypothetical protein [Massilia sp. DJPM01]
MFALWIKLDDMTKNAWGYLSRVRRLPDLMRIISTWYLCQWLLFCILDYDIFWRTKKKRGQPTSLAVRNDPEKLLDGFACEYFLATI